MPADAATMPLKPLLWDRSVLRAVVHLQSAAEKAHSVKTAGEAKKKATPKKEKVSLFCFIAAARVSCS